MSHKRQIDLTSLTNMTGMDHERSKQPFNKVFFMETPLFSLNFADFL